MRSAYIIFTILLGCLSLGMVIFASIDMNAGSIDAGFALLVLALFPGAGAYLFYRLLRKPS